MSQPLARLCPNPSENLTEDQVRFLSSSSIPKNAEYVFSKDAIKKWSTARVQAWKKRESHPDAYYYRFVDPHQYQTNGGFNDIEHKAFMKQLQDFTEKGFLGHSWGMFSVGVPNKAGYQCSAYQKSLLLKRRITDPSFSIINGKLVMVDKTKKFRHVPSHLSDAWRDPAVKAIVQQIDRWVSEFHDSLTAKSEQSLFKPSKPKKPKTGPAENGIPALSFQRQEVDNNDAQEEGCLSSVRSQAKPDFELFQTDEEDFEISVVKSPRVIPPIEPSDDALATIENMQDPAPLRDPLRPSPFKEIEPIDLVVSDSTALDSVSENKVQAPTEGRSNVEICDSSSDDFEVSKTPACAFQAFFAKRPHANLGLSMRTKTMSPCIRKRKRDQKDLSFFWKGVKPAYIEGPDPDVVRIPDIVPPTWANLIRPLAYLDSPSAASVLKVEDVFDLKVHDLKSLPSDKPLQLEGILVDPPWPAVSPEAFFPLLSSLLREVCRLMRSGFVFIWVPKHLQFGIFKLFVELGMRYVENLVWCQVALENRFVTVSSEIICKSKAILLIFKKGDEIDIRHQRTADVLFDFVKPQASWAGKNLSCPKPLAVYEMIETLLPNSHLVDDQQPWRLLELWFKDTDFTPPRPNWIQVHQLIKPA